MPILSVITAVQRHRAGMLREAGESLRDQKLPAGWELEWLVQEDGGAPALAELVTGFPSARYAANGEQLGVAITRNFALARARGELVQVLDSDDVLLPGAVATMVEIMCDHPGIHWAAAQADDLLADGSRSPFPVDIVPGPIPPGAINAFLAARGRLPLLCASLVARTGTVRALGGWTALPFGEDTCLIMTLGELTPGYLTDSVTWLVRKHAGNMTASAGFHALAGACRLVARQRLDAVRALGLRFAAADTSHGGFPDADPVGAHAGTA